MLIKNSFIKRKLSKYCVVATNSFKILINNPKFRNGENSIGV
jgi:hypothetical protein